MNIVVDIGNTRVKVGYFQGEELLAVNAYPHQDFPQAVLTSEAWRQFSPRSKYLGLVSVGNAEMVKATETLLEAEPGLEMRRIDRDTALPIGNRYGSPQTLGMDRVCAAVAGYQRAGSGPVLVIGAGTAVTYDYVDAHGDYLGGAIAPGGLLVADNVLGAGSWWIDDAPGRPDRDAMDRFNRTLAQDERFEVAAVPIREGVLIARRR